VSATYGRAMPARSPVPYGSRPPLVTADLVVRAAARLEEVALSTPVARWPAGPGVPAERPPVPHLDARPEPPVNAPAPAAVRPPVDPPARGAR
jgi:hypothetical protein